MILLDAIVVNKEKERVPHTKEVLFNITKNSPKTKDTIWNISTF